MPELGFKKICTWGGYNVYLKVVFNKKQGGLGIWILLDFNVAVFFSSKYFRFLFVKLSLYAIGRK
jgi:hypothetical protein